MFYITHTYAATKIMKITYKDHFLVTGLSIPDLPLFGSTLDEKELHSRGLEFKEYLEKRDKLYVPLATGMMLHGSTPTGLDFYTHSRFDNEKLGYAYKHGQPLLEKVKKLRERLTPPGIRSPLTDEEIAHNFIEMGVEILVAKDHPETIELFENTIYKLTNIQLKTIAEYLSGFFKGSTDEQDIRDFYKLFRPKKFTTLEGIVETYPKILARMLSNIPDKSIQGIIPDQVVVTVSNRMGDMIEKMVSKDALKGLIKQAVEIVEPTYEQFLTKSIESMRAEMEKLDFA